MIGPLGKEHLLAGWRCEVECDFALPENGKAPDNKCGPDPQGLSHQTPRSLAPQSSEDIYLDLCIAWHCGPQPSWTEGEGPHRTTAVHTWHLVRILRQFAFIIHPVHK